MKIESFGRLLLETNAATHAVRDFAESAGTACRKRCLTLRTGWDAS